MIPLKDDAPRIGTPYVNYTLIVLNVLAFLYELLIQNSYGRRGLDAFTMQVGMVPAKFSVLLFNNGFVPWNLRPELGTDRISLTAAVLGIFVSMFLHAGLVLNDVRTIVAAP